MILEVYIEVFPRNFGTMIGVHAFLFITTVFLAFSVLMSVENALGLQGALLTISVLCGFGVTAALLLEASKEPKGCCGKEKPDKEEGTDRSEDSEFVTNAFAPLAMTMVPSAPTFLQSYALPISFYLAVLGNKGIGYFFNTFSVFSVSLYSSNYSGFSPDAASLATGLAGLVAGFLSPIFGILTDKYGQTTLLFTVGCGFGLAGFLILLLGDQSLAVWIATGLISVMNSMQDHAIVAIPLVVGSSRAGAGYGLYGLLGNLFDALVSVLSGKLLSGGNDNNFLIFSAAVAALGIFSWLGLFFLERKRTFIEKPLSEIVSTSTEAIQAASLVSVIHTPNN